MMGTLRAVPKSTQLAHYSRINCTYFSVPVMLLRVILGRGAAVAKQRIGPQRQKGSEESKW